jgi:competence protein ComEC
VLIASILLSGMFSGYLLGSIRLAMMVRSDLYARIGTTLDAELVVTGAVRSHGGWQSATAVIRKAAGSPAGPGMNEPVLLEVAPDGVVTLELEQGAIIRATGMLEAPQGRSESGYDQARQLLHQGIRVVFSAKAETITVIGHRDGVAGWFDNLRASARDHLSRGPSPRVNEVLQGVVMGDTAGIDEGWMDAFRRSGTAHMLSVSGLHVASLAAIMLGLARLLRAPRWAGFLLAAAAALLLVPFVGPSPPVVRSAAMIVVVLVARWVGRGRDQWQVLALAAVVCLLINPFAVFDVGFQLSFAAFLGMLLLIKPVQHGLRFLPPAVASNVAVSLAASLGTAPVALAVFGKTSLVSPLANLLVVPALPFITGLGLASVFIGFIWSGFSAVLDTVASLPMVWTIQVSRVMGLAPVLSSTDLGRAALAVVTAGAALPVALAFLGRLVRVPLGLPLPFFRRCTAWARTHMPGERKWAVLLATGVVTAGLAMGASAYPVIEQGMETLRVVLGGRAWPDQVELRVLDVGQGNAVLLRTPQHHAMLFDGGPGGCGLAHQLRALGVHDLDLVVVSHPHADHFAGLLEVVDSVKIRLLIDDVVVSAEQDRTKVEWTDADQVPVGTDGGQGASEAAAYLALRRQLERAGSRYARAVTGDSLTIDDVLVTFFAPRSHLVLVDGPAPWSARGDEPSGDELNASSLVTIVSAGSIDVLLPGDAEAEVLRRYSLPPTEVLMVPHHGSRGAVSADLLARWGTRVALVSVGRDNRFGHPDAGTIATLERSVGCVVRTDTAGWVCCTMHGPDLTISAEHMPTDDETTQAP